MVSLTLNTNKGSNWDLVIENGDVLMVADNDYIAQKVKQILLFNRGEFFRNTDAGIPWFQEFLGVKNPDFAAMKSVIKDSLKKNDVLIGLGVTSVSVDNIVVDKQARTMSMSIDVATDDNVTTTEVTI